MKTNPNHSRRRLRLASFATAALAAGSIALAFADTPIPDPPVPAEGPVLLASADTSADPDCRCGAMRARDLESQVDRHVEQWQALHDPRAPKPSRLHPKQLVEGVVGFPVRHYRLAADDDSTGTR